MLSKEAGISRSTPTNVPGEVEGWASTVFLPARGTHARVCMWGPALWLNLIRLDQNYVRVPVGGREMPDCWLGSLGRASGQGEAGRTGLRALTVPSSSLQGKLPTCTLTQTTQECLNGTRVSMYFDTHIWGLPFSPDLPATQGNMGGQFNPNFIAEGTEAPARRPLLCWPTQLGCLQLFPAHPWTRSLFPETGDPAAGQGLRWKGFGVPWGLRVALSDLHNAVRKEVWASLGRRDLSEALVCMHAQSVSCVRVFATPWTVACQAPLSMGFSRQGYWSGLPHPSPGDLPDPGIEPRSPVSPVPTGKFFTTESPGKSIRGTYSYEKGKLASEEPPSQI